VINYYIKASHSPTAWKVVMGLMASHAAMVAPMQAATEISLGILLVIGLLTRPAAFVAFLFLTSLWVSEWGTSWIWNYWFRCSHRSDSRWDAQVEPGHRRVAGAAASASRGGDERICVRVSVIIPTHNEAQAMAVVLADLPSNLVTEVIVVDSNSTDGTPDLPGKMGAQVIQEPAPRIRRACLTGLANTPKSRCGRFPRRRLQRPPFGVADYLAPIIEGRADITLGSRFGGKSNPGALPWHQSFGNRLAAGLIRLLVWREGQ